MMITLNCGWGMPGEELEYDTELNESGRGVAAMFGFEVMPAPKAANDNQVEYLNVVI